MTWWRRFVRQPQQVFLRKAAFQVHLWIGLALGLYIVMLSITGSALVFRREMDASFRTPLPEFQESARVMTTEEISARAKQLYPGYTITFVSKGVRRRNPTIEVAMTRGTDAVERLFNPYTGEDLGDAFPWKSRALLWVVNLHDDLLFDREGRWWNGFLSGVVAVLCLTGAIVWWPGVMRWRRGMAVKWSLGWRRINFDIHSAIGFWTFALMMIWAISGIYLGIPDPFTSTSEYFGGPDGTGKIGQALDVTMLWMTRLHFGRWRNIPLQILWVILGLIPAILFVTGAIMWWQRVMRRRNPFTGRPVVKTATVSVDRAAFSVVSLAESGRDIAYWQTRPVDERVRAVEVQRQIIYGRPDSPARLQRIFEVAERASG
jgi:uncharacterized iron-regulated membrane protein